MGGFAENIGERQTDIASPLQSVSNINAPATGVNLGEILKPYTDNHANGGYGLPAFNRVALGAYVSRPSAQYKDNRSWFDGPVKKGSNIALGAAAAIATVGVLWLFSRGKK